MTWSALSMLRARCALNTNNCLCLSNRQKRWILALYIVDNHTKMQADTHALKLKDTTHSTWHTVFACLSPKNISPCSCTLSFGPGSLQGLSMSVCQPYLISSHVEMPKQLKDGLSVSLGSSSVSGQLCQIQFLLSSLCPPTHGHVDKVCDLYLKQFIPTLTLWTTPESNRGGNACAYSPALILKRVATCHFHPFYQDIHLNRT